MKNLSYLLVFTFLVFVSVGSYAVQCPSLDKQTIYVCHHSLTVNGWTFDSSLCTEGEYILSPGATSIWSGKKVAAVYASPLGWHLGIGNFVTGCVFTATPTKPDSKKIIMVASYGNNNISPTGEGWVYFEKNCEVGQCKGKPFNTSKPISGGFSYECQTNCNFK